MATLRESLKVERIYKETKSGQYFVTPDGIGCFWYETLEEAQEQHGDTGRVIVISELSDF
jgi:hypothetical protein